MANFIHLTVLFDMLAQGDCLNCHSAIGNLSKLETYATQRGRTMPLPGFQICLQLCVTLICDLLTHKVDDAIAVQATCLIGIEIRSLSKFCVDMFDNRLTSGHIDRQTGG